MALPSLPSPPSAPSWCHGLPHIASSLYWPHLPPLPSALAPECCALPCCAVLCQSPISVVGYPVGGDSLSITKGIVSRLSLVRYSPAARLLGIQIDAAINPGRLGG